MSQLSPTPVKGKVELPIVAVNRYLYRPLEAIVIKDLPFWFSDVLF